MRVVLPDLLVSARLPELFRLLPVPVLVDVDLPLTSSFELPRADVLLLPVGVVLLLAVVREVPDADFRLLPDVTVRREFPLNSSFADEERELVPVLDPEDFAVERDEEVAVRFAGLLVEFFVAIVDTLLKLLRNYSRTGSWYKFVLQQKRKCYQKKLITLWN